MPRFLVSKMSCFLPQKLVLTNGRFFEKFFYHKNSFVKDVVSIFRVSTHLNFPKPYIINIINRRNFRSWNTIGIFLSDIMYFDKQITFTKRNVHRHRRSGRTFFDARKAHDMLSVKPKFYSTFSWWILLTLWKKGTVR